MEAIFLLVILWLQVITLCVILRLLRGISQLENILDRLPTITTRESQSVHVLSQSEDQRELSPLPPVPRLPVYVRNPRAHVRDSSVSDSATYVDMSRSSSMPPHTYAAPPNSLRTEFDSDCSLEI